MTKIIVTKTFGPLHFEDLAPDRFEDLVRDLIYDFKDWQKIEAVGRCGNESGSDIIAYERLRLDTLDDDNGSSEVEEKMFSVDNRWMIQAKRHAKLTPNEITAILKDININDPPYGYILAVTANLSKKSQDVFTKILSQKGVMEFYLWGKSELEAMLYLPKNDRILFTFFGISLTSKKNILKTTIRSRVNVKNKLINCLGEGNNIHQTLLVRDLKDTAYPYEKNCDNFCEFPTWEQYTIFSHHPLGLLCHVKKFFAYYNQSTREWDYTDDLNLFLAHKHDSIRMQEWHEKEKLICDFCKYSVNPSFKNAGQ